MLDAKQIEQARNLLSLALWHDAQGKLFESLEEAHKAIYSADVFYWLFGDDTVRASCSWHESADFRGFLELMKSRLKKAGYADPESDEVYRMLKQRMRSTDKNLFGVLAEALRDGH